MASEGLEVAVLWGYLVGQSSLAESVLKGQPFPLLEAAATSADPEELDLRQEPALPSSSLVQG